MREPVTPVTAQWGRDLAPGDMQPHPVQPLAADHRIVLERLGRRRHRQGIERYHKQMPPRFGGLGFGDGRWLRHDLRLGVRPNEVPETYSRARLRASRRLWRELIDDPAAAACRIR